MRMHADNLSGFPPEKAHPRLILSLPLARLAKANDIPKLLCPIPYRLQARSCRHNKDA